MDEDDWKRLGVFATAFAVMFLFVHQKSRIVKVERELSMLIKNTQKLAENEHTNSMFSLEKINDTMNIIKLHLEFQHGLSLTNH